MMIKYLSYFWRVHLPIISANPYPRAIGVNSFPPIPIFCAMAPSPKSTSKNVPRNSAKNCLAINGNLKFTFSANVIFRSSATLLNSGLTLEVAVLTYGEAAENLKKIN